MLQTKKLTQLILAACVAASSGAVYAAQPNSVSVDINYWRPQVNNHSEMRLPNSSTVNLKNDLGLSKANSLNLTVNFKTDDTHTWYIGGDGITIKESKKLAKAFTFNGKNFAAGNAASSELKTSHTQIGLRSDRANSSFYTNYQLNHCSVKTTISNNAAQVSASRDKSFTALGLGFGWETKKPEGVNFFAEFTPLSLSSSGAYSDCKLGVKAHISQNITGTLGYKVENIRAGKKDAIDRTELHLQGLYFSLGGSF